ncbi:MAG: SprT-like domain-containing protein [Actinomycetia bacterium]|nr:SprT-like domain-containing protein [Actinomycetes bacterium]
MRTSAALRLARELMNAHGLHDWSVGLDRAKTRAGATRFALRRITLSAPLTRAHDEAMVRDTILHEIAHALVGPSHGHDRVWKAKAREIGTSDARCFDSPAARELAPFIGTCPAGHEVRRHRRPSRLVACAQCSKTYDPRHLFEWTYRGRAFTHHPNYLKELHNLADPVTAASPLSRLEIGDAAMITAAGTYQHRVGVIEGVGRTRYQVRVREGILTVPFALVEPA